jgi:protein-arginine kinase
MYFGISWWHHYITEGEHFLVMVPFKDHLQVQFICMYGQLTLSILYNDINILYFNGL